MRMRVMYITLYQEKILILEILTDTPNTKIDSQAPVCLSSSAWEASFLTFIIR